MTTYAYTSNNEIDVIEANHQIELNSGIPTPDGKTTAWSIPTLTLAPYNFWFIYMPPAEGWNGYSQKEMIQDVTNVDIQEFNVAWIRPPEPPQ